MTLGLATLGELPEGGRRLERRGDAGGHAAGGDRARAARPGRGPGVHAQLRHALGARHASRRRDRPAAETGGWIRTAEPRALDAPLVAAMTDAWAPAAFVALGRFVAAPTLDLTIHVRRPLPVAGMAPEDYVLGRFSTRLSVAGVWEEDGELWSRAAS